MIKKYRAPILVQLFLSASLTAICVFAGIQITEGIKYFCFQGLFILVPGWCISHIFLGKTKSIYEKIAFSYCFGLMHLIFQYYLLSVLHINNFSFIYNLLVLSLSVFYIWKKRSEFKYEDNNIVSDILILAISTFLVVTCFFTVTYTNPLPTINGGANYNQDFLYWIGNNISFTKLFPVQCFRQPGIQYYYHHFSSIIIAQSSMSTDIDVYTLSVCFSYMVPVLLLVLSTYSMINRVTDNKILLALGVVAILLSEGSTTYLTSHLYFCSFGFDYGYACAMLSVLHLWDIYQKDHMTVLDIFVSCLMLMFMTGLKGPVAIVVLIGYGYVAFMMLFTNFKKGFVCGVLWLVSFLFVYFFIIMGIHAGYEQSNGLEFLGIAGSFDNNRWAIGILNELVDKGWSNNTVTKLISIFLYVYRSNILSMTFAIIATLYVFVLVAQKKKVNIILPICILIVLWGALLTIVTYQNGNSQMYFLMSTVPFGIMSGYSILNEIKVNKVMVVTIVAFICVLSYSDIKRCVYERIYLESKNGQAIHDGTDYKGYYKYYASEDDYNVSLWLKNNTESNDIIAVDQFQVNDYRKEEIYGVFSQRYIYNDGAYESDAETAKRRTNVQLFINSITEGYNALVSDGVKYLIVHKNVNGKSRIDHCEKVYESTECDIYKIIW